MTVYSQWYNNYSTILHVVYEPGWTWRDMHQHARQTVAPTVLSTGKPVALIVDFSASPLMPPREFSENIKQSIHDYRNLNIDVVVFTLQESSIAGLLQTSHRYYGTAGRVYLTAKTVDEAVRQINEQRAELSCAV